jgi:TetR/AcrR family transcriptional regulator, tetracycline repressor protein
MRLTRDRVLDGAFAILDEYGLGDLTMRRLAASLGIRAGGLYWHFADKQTLLAAMADRVVADLRSPENGDWRTDLQGLVGDFRGRLLAHSDGAELVAAGYALHPGAGEPLDTMIKILESGGMEAESARAAGTALIHYVLGHTAEVQAHGRLRAAGALPEPEDGDPDPEATFELGLALFLDGAAHRIG